MSSTQYNKKLQLTCLISDAIAMTKLGAQLAAGIKPGCIIYLDGDLGAGKTTLVRGFLSACGYQGAVKSPTFTVVEPYSLDYNKLYDYNELHEGLKIDDPIDRVTISNYDIITENAQKIYHFDLYRLEDPEELEYLGIRDYLDGQAIALIEWPGKGQGVLPKADLLIKITHQRQGRGVTLQPQSKLGAAIVSRIALRTCTQVGV